MLFLIQYDKALGRIVEMQTFADTDRASVEASRSALELANVRTGSQIEVVLLEAATEQALRRTHRRYFETLEELIEPAPAER